MRDLSDFQNLNISWVQNKDKIMIMKINLTKRKGWEIVINNDKIIFINGPAAFPMRLNDEIDDKYKKSIRYEKEYIEVEFKTKTLWNKLFSNDKDVQDKSEIDKINSII